MVKSEENCVEMSVLCVYQVYYTCLSLISYTTPIIIQHTLQHPMLVYQLHQLAHPYLLTRTTYHLHG